MTRREVSSAALALPDEDKLELIGDLWDALGDSAPTPQGHRDEIERRVAEGDAAKFSPWPDAKARILSRK